MQGKIDKLRKLVQRRHIVRPRDLDAAGLPRNYLARLVRRGQLQRLDRGLYAASSLPVSEHLSLLEVSRRAPNAVVCLLSALRFHEILGKLISVIAPDAGVGGFNFPLTPPVVRREGTPAN